jgi:multiple sugar transport system ATP-binding protein
VAEADDGPVELGIRPEDFFAGEACLGAPESCRFAAEVRVVEPMGSESLLVISVARHDLRMRLDGRRYPRVGDRIGLAVNPAELHVFDAASGRSLRR